MLRFIIVAGLSFVVLVTVSFLWPRLTSGPRPQPFSQIYTAVRASSAGPQIAQVLGVSSEAEVTPVNIPGIVNGAVKSAVSSVESYTANALLRETTKQLENHMQALTPEQKTALRLLICTPEESSASSKQ